MKTAIVTGAGSGMGLATARLLAGQGYAVQAVDLRPSGEAIAGLEAHAVDIRRDDEVAWLIEAALAQHGRIDALVNCAGVALGGAVEEASLDEARDLFETNFFGAARLIKAVLPAMRRQGAGTIVNVSSGAAQVAQPFAGYYSASKFALEGLTEALRMEVRPFGVRAALLVPGWTRTNIVGHGRVPSESLPVYARVRAAIEALCRRFVATAPLPDRVARTVAKILGARNPRLRYRVGNDVVGSYWTKKILPASVYERMVRGYYQLEG